MGQESAKPNTKNGSKGQKIVLNNYKRGIDDQETIDNIHIDKSMFDFLVAELNPRKVMTFTSLAIRQNGFIFLFRILMFQLFLVTNQFLPVL
jgi:hypothetical protein